MTKKIFRLNDEFTEQLNKRYILATNEVLNSTSESAKEHVRAYVPSQKHIQSLI
jgi:hypothetical protein